MSDAPTSSSLAQLLALIQGNGGQPQQYPVDQMLPSRQFGPPNQSMQPMPPGLPPNIMAMWASMAPDLRAQYMAATQQNLGAGPMGQNPQLASLNPMQGQGRAPTRITPAMIEQFANLQPQVQYGDPMAMRPNNDMINKLGSAQQMSDIAYTGR